MWPKVSFGLNMHQQIKITYSLNISVIVCASCNPTDVLPDISFCAWPSFEGKFPSVAGQSFRGTIPLCLAKPLEEFSFCGWPSFLSVLQCVLVVNICAIRH
uniref:Uncharacterized protein n=1 Tax=Cacopsylla melanoneura TaxID=428564 RepID=A0A8D9B310_9HEMI